MKKRVIRKRARPRLRAGFAEIDITPPPGTCKIGWLKVVVGAEVADPLHARVAVLESRGQCVGFVQLDTLCVRASMVREIRKRIETTHGFPGARIMIAATHNHAGPAVANVGDVARDEAYCLALVGKVIEAFGQALANRRAAEVGFGRALNWELARNRRVVMRGGIVKTHGAFADPDALCLEGPSDPEVIVMAARRPGGALLGAIINYACHPTHEGDSPKFSAGWPGAMVKVLKQNGCPMPLYLNGALGNVHTVCPILGQREMETCGHLLADSVQAALRGMRWRRELDISGVARKVAVPFRKATKAEVAGTVRGAQRFVDPAIYDRGMPALLAEMRARGKQSAEVQVLRVDEFAFVGLPAEVFVELGLAIKEQAHPLRACVVGLANGMVGYVPTRAAFARGGYETTFAASSKLAPEAGDLLVKMAVRLLRAKRKARRGR